MLFIIDNNKDVVGTLKNNIYPTSENQFFDDEFGQDLETGAETFSFTTLPSSKYAKFIKIGNYIAFKENQTGKYKLFQITNTKEFSGEYRYIEVFCEGAGLELLRTVFRKRKINSADCRLFLKTILYDTGWLVGYTDSSLMEVLTINIDKDDNPISIINNNIHKYGAEVEFAVEIENGKITKKIVNAYKKRGRETYKRFEIGRNIDEIVRTEDSSELVTALIGRGTNEINFKEVVLPDISKPIGQDFIVDEVAFKKYNNEGKHVFGVFDYETTSPQELLRETKKALDILSKPKITYEVKCTMLDNDVQLGDTVTIVDHYFTPPIYVEARVGKLTTSFTDPMKNVCTFTNFKKLHSKITTVDFNMEILGEKFFKYKNGEPINETIELRANGKNLPSGNIYKWKYYNKPLGTYEDIERSNDSSLLLRYDDDFVKNENDIQIKVELFESSAETNVLNVSDGEDASNHMILCSSKTISRSSDGVLIPNAITLNAKKKQGSKDMIDFSGKFVVEYSVDSPVIEYPIYESKKEENKITFEVPPLAKLIRCRLYENINGVGILAEETLVVLNEGKDGTEMTPDEVFDKLTNYGQKQGLFQDSNGDIYANVEYLYGNLIKGHEFRTTKNNNGRYIRLEHDQANIYQGEECDENRRVSVGLRPFQNMYVPSIMLGQNGVNPNVDGAMVAGGTYLTLTHYPNIQNPFGLNESMGGMSYKCNANPNGYNAMFMTQTGATINKAINRHEFRLTENNYKRAEITNTQMGFYFTNQQTPDVVITGEGIRVNGELIGNKEVVAVFG